MDTQEESSLFHKKGSSNSRFRIATCITAFTDQTRNSNFKPMLSNHLKSVFIRFLLSPNIYILHESSLICVVTVGISSVL